MNERERERFEAWWASTKCDSALMMIAAWTAWKARAEFSEEQLEMITRSHRNKGE